MLFRSRVNTVGLVFLATDSQQIKHKAKQKFKTLKTINDISIHIDRSSINHTSDLTTTARDFEALVNANCLIFGRSGFSELALFFPGNNHNLTCSCKIPLKKTDSAVCGSQLHGY